MIISMIAAMSQNRTIGKDNQLPWHLPDDMQYFMQTTQGHCVIMGRKNFDSIPEKFRPLPNRTNIVVTRDVNWQAEGVTVAHSIQEALTVAQQLNEQEVFVIGGSEIYEQALTHADQLYLTEIHAIIEGDRFFPEIDPAAWQEDMRTHHPIDDRHQYAFDFVRYKRA